MNDKQGGNGTVTKRSRAYYVTVPKDVRKMAGLRKGDRVHVTYNTHYKQVIITKVRYADESLPFRRSNSKTLDAFGTG